MKFTIETIVDPRATYDNVGFSIRGISIPDLQTKAEAALQSGDTKQLPGIIEEFKATLKSAINAIPHSTIETVQSAIDYIKSPSIQENLLKNFLINLGKFVIAKKLNHALSNLTCRENKEPDREISTALLKYCLEQQPILREAAQVLITQCGADVNQIKTPFGTMLHQAAYDGDTKKVKMLLELKADPTQKGHGGDTPLHIAARREDDKLLRIMLPYVDTEAAIAIENNEGENILEAAKNRGKVQTVRMLKNEYGMRERSLCERLCSRITNTPNIGAAAAMFTTAVALTALNEYQKAQNGRS